MLEPIDREKLSIEPCPRCVFEAEVRDMFDRESIQQLPKGAYAPLSQKWCWDCNAAHTINRNQLGIGWDQIRVAVASDRRESYRAPNSPITLLIVKEMIKPCDKGALDAQLEWLDEMKIVIDHMAALKMEDLGIK